MQERAKWVAQDEEAERTKARQLAAAGAVRRRNTATLGAVIVRFRVTVTIPRFSNYRSSTGNEFASDGNARPAEPADDSSDGSLRSASAHSPLERRDRTAENKRRGSAADGTNAAGERIRWLIAIRTELRSGQNGSQSQQRSVGAMLAQRQAMSRGPDLKIYR